MRGVGGWTSDEPGLVWKTRSVTAGHGLLDASLSAPSAPTECDYLTGCFCSDCFCHVFAALFPFRGGRFALSFRSMIHRYSRPEMRAIWTDENKLKIWLRIELLAAEALVKEGIVPRADFAKMKQGAE